MKGSFAVIFEKGVASPPGPYKATAGSAPLTRCKNDVGGLAAKPRSDRFVYYVK